MSRLSLSPCLQNPREALSLCWLEGKKQEERVGGGGWGEGCGGRLERGQEVPSLLFT